MTGAPVLRFTPEDLLRVQGLVDAFATDDLDHVIAVLGVYCGDDRVAEPTGLIIALLVVVDSLSRVAAHLQGVDEFAPLAAACSLLAGKAWEAGS